MGISTTASLEINEPDPFCLLKQFTGVERCQARFSRAQRNHIGCAIRAFVRLEYHRFTTGISWFAAKGGIVRDAVRAYLAKPLYRLPIPANA